MVEKLLLKNLAELAERRAMNIREEAQLWDILARDLKREAKRSEEVSVDLQNKVPKDRPVPNCDEPEKRLFVRTKEAREMMGIGQTSLYEEINSGRLPTKKSGGKTLIAIKDIHAWFDSLPSMRCD